MTPGSVEENLLQVFLTEAYEHLDVIENRSLELENIIKEGQIPSIDLYDTIFRAIHTLKGSAGIYEFYTLEQFAHLIETPLEKLRKNQMSASLEVIEFFFKSHDTLKQILSNIKSSGSDKDFDISEIKSIILKILPDIQVGEKHDSVPADYYLKYPSIKNLILSLPQDLQNVLQEYEINRLIEINKTKQPVYWLKIFLNKDFCVGSVGNSHDCSLQKTTFMQNLTKYGEIITLTPLIDLLPILDNFNNKNFDLPLALIFSSSVSSEDLATKLNIPQEQIYLLGKTAPLTTNNLGRHVENRHACSLQKEKEIPPPVIPAMPIKALIVSSCNQFFAIPLNLVTEIYRAKEQDIYSVNQIPVVNIRDSVVPVFLLDKIYNLTNENTDVFFRTYIVVIKLSATLN